MRKLTIEELNRLSVEEFKQTEKKDVVVVLDNIRSLHNVGSILRTCDAFLIDKVYLCGITPKPPHREIRKTAIGAEESVDWRPHADSVALVQSLIAEGYTILSLEQTEGSTLLSEFEVEDTQKYALVLGHEVSGVSQAIVDLSHYALEIPQFGTKHSLNVSIAAGIALYALTVG